MKMLAAVILVFAFVTQAWSAVPTKPQNVFHITSTKAKEARYVKVTDYGAEISFQFCNRTTKRCEQIGPHARYMKKHMSQQRVIEYVRGVSVTAADAGIAVLAFIGGTRAVAAVGSAGPQGYVLYTLGKRALGGLVAAGASQIATWSTYYMNPFTYTKRSGAAGRALNYGNSKEANIVEFRDQLDDFLHQMDIRWGFIPWF